MVSHKAYCLAKIKRFVGIRIACQLYIDSEQLFTLTGVNKLLDMSEAHLLNLMYKRVHTPRYLDHIGTRTRIHDAPTLIVPYPRTEFYQKSVQFRGSVAWNNLPTYVRNLPTYEAFKIQNEVS